VERVRGSPEATQRVLVRVSWSADGLGRLLGDAQLEHPGFHALCALPAIADARPGARLAADDDHIRIHRSRRNHRDALDLWQTNSRSCGIDAAFRQPAGYRLRDCRHLCSAADDEYGCECRIAIERFFEFESKDDFVCNWWAHYRRHWCFDDAMEAHELCRPLYLYVARRLFRFDGRHCRHTDLRLLGA